MLCVKLEGEELRKVLFVAFAVLSVLVAIFLYFATGTIQHYKSDRAIGGLNILYQIVEEHVNEGNEYPKDLEELRSVLLGKGISENKVLDLLTDPWGKKYYYQVIKNDKRSSFELWTYGEDGFPEGQGEASDIRISKEKGLF